ncbi:hypothetical protein JCM21900_002935 [Sporobolomyces salmonicolor]
MPSALSLFGVATLLLSTSASVSAQLVVAGANGGEGGALTGPVSSPESAGYSCDPSSCQAPNCVCASSSPPGGLSPQDVPQFITFTADDAIQSYTIEVLDYFLGQRKPANALSSRKLNPNGCPATSTYFTSLMYTNYSLVTDWYVAGNEIADHTMTHVGTPNASEVNGNLRALNAFSGIPMSEIQGFRAPFLNWTGETMQLLHNASFTYDSSATSASLPNASSTDAYWPYTLDNGFANNCLDVDGICQGQLKLPGMWEIPMYATFEDNNPSAIHLMDPWLDTDDPQAALAWMKSTFLSHYNGNRQPFGIYSHPIHLAVGYPGITDPNNTRIAIQQFLDWATAMPNVWLVSNQQLLAWMKNPVTNANIAQVQELGCSVPDVPASAQMCNGIPQNEMGLLNKCDFTDFPCCYYCPATEPTPDNPVPPPAAGDTRHTLPDDCSTPWFNPQSNQCLCQSSSCSFTDTTRPIGNYSTNLGGSGSDSGSGTQTAASAERTAPGINSAGRSTLSVVGVIGAVVAGAAAIMAA